MTVKELEEITARHETAIAANTTTLEQHTTILAEIQATSRQILDRLALLEPHTRPPNPPPPPPFQQPHQQHIQGRPLRLDFPRFEGEEPEGWLFQAEQFFTLNPMPVKQHVTMASIHLRGDAVAWYRWLKSSMGELTWQ